MGDPESEKKIPETLPVEAGADSVAPGVEAGAEDTAPPQPALAPPAPGPGPYYGTGRRKTSVARVYLRSGSGRWRVNGRNFKDFFLTAHWREHASEPLKFLGCADQYDAEIKVSGGGSGGQAGAVRLGLARALLEANPGLRPKLRQRGFLTRDPRMKERKKYGQKGARKRFQWTKR